MAFRRKQSILKNGILLSVIAAFYAALFPFNALSQQLFSSAPRLVTIFERFMKFLLTIIGALGVIAFVVSGIIYLTSAGSEDQAEQGKRALFYAIVGLVVGLSAFIIIATIDTLLR